MKNFLLVLLLVLMASPARAGDMPLDQPHMETGDLLMRVMARATDAMSFDSASYAEKLSRPAADFTTPGREAYLAALQKLKMEDSLKTARTVTAAPVTPPVIENQGIHGGRYRWLVKMPLTLVYKGDRETHTSPVRLVMIVERVPMAENSGGFAFAGWDVFHGVEKPLDQPVMDNAALLEWAAAAARATLTFTWADYKPVMEKTADYFTKDGQESYDAALQGGGILAEVQKQKYAVTAVNTAAPKLVTQGVQNKKLRYVVELPLQVTYDGETEKRVDDVKLTLVIQRVSDTESGTGMAIDQWIGRAQIGETRAK